MDADVIVWLVFLMVTSGLASVFWLGAHSVGYINTIFISGV
jgi:hypothetical protein